MRKIDLINLDNINSSTWKKTANLTENVDEYDTPFIALSLELGAPLWTGDKKLAAGWQKKGITWIYGTEKIIKLRDSQ